MHRASVFNGIHPINWVHSALFHHPAAGGILFKVSGPDSAIALSEQLLNGSGKGFGGIALILMIRVNDIPQFDGAVLDFHIVDKTNQVVSQTDCPFKMLVLMGKHQNFPKQRLCSGIILKFRQHKGFADFAVSQKPDGFFPVCFRVAA